ncbi:hypothetical protein TraAM80_01858 [Trypanosoma rangeli]|uniref:Cyclic nucleotide-binding domain-containing protein n=1 Tax=Trypanosoma rangeli TaxID=5698 RepID=A0A422NXG9_TRYRA|nr:uncharacterized protein TraAM80_01858 [Trypanosoma rangeli]RNF10109.1 hypothetical protein TraAM80_01858 [Trypanosoma rangeli]|eukprot:RNF10109.1 hypothetical protein TraAM80_01858 [Trypanosoma rangeli]
MFLSPVVESRLRLKLHVARRRLATRRVIQVVPKLDAGKLLSCPLFAKWPSAALSELRLKMVWEVHVEGDALLYGGMPCNMSSLFWIVSGELAELPNRRDLCESRRLSKAVGNRVSSVYNIGDERASSGALHAEFHQNLATFGAGQFAAGERLFLGLPYDRTMRCESNVTGFAVSFRVVQRLQKKWQVSPKASVSAAKEIMQEQLLRRDERPLLSLALLQNPILRCLDAATLSILWIRLSPIVVCANEIICDDVFAADTISFLQSGEVCVGDNRGHCGRKTISCGGAVGLHSFAPSEVPCARDEKHPAVALTFSQLWRVGWKAFSEAVSDTEWKRCAAAALKTIDFRIDRSLLDRAEVFSSLSSSKLETLANRMELRVVRGDAYILPPQKKPQEVIVVLVGTVYFEAPTPAEKVPHGVKAARTRIPCGDPVAFAECIAEVPLQRGVFAATGAVIVSLTRRAMVKVLRKGDRPEIDPAVTEAAMAQLGVPLIASGATCIVNKAQEKAARRVRKYAQVQHSSEAPQNVPSLYDNVDQLIGISTQVLSTLAVQLQSLRPGVWQTECGGVLYDTASRTVMKKQSPNERLKPHRPHTCFTLDEKGCVVFCSTDAVVD